jgi:OOP family OmpA-OmpF porin|tara:strand:- start:3878 stop:5692 length:1815 start_codon:yes stop_codon:yes gene_type:complete
MKKIINIKIFLFGLIVSVLFIVFAFVLVNYFEKKTLEVVLKETSDTELSWLEVSTDGTRVIVSGFAPDEANRFIATSKISSIINSERIIDQIIVKKQITPSTIEYVLEILRDDNHISVIGFVPTNLQSKKLIAKLKVIAKDLEVRNLLEVSSFPITDAWKKTLDYAIASVELLPNSKISIAKEEIWISALSESIDDKIRIENQLTSLDPGFFKLHLDIQSPRPLIQPFSLRFTMDESGASLDKCSASDEYSKVVILSAMIKLGVDKESNCEIGIGVPADSWVDAVIIAATYVKEFEIASLTFENHNVSLVVSGNTGNDKFENIIDKLKKALPNEFQVGATLQPVLTKEIDNTNTFTVIKSLDGVVELKGFLNDHTAEIAVRSYASSIFGSININDSLRLSDKLPQNWPIQVLTGLEVVGLLDHGSLIIEPNTILLEGKSANPEIKSIVSEILSKKLGNDILYTLKLEYDEQLVPKPIGPDAKKCVLDINNVIETLGIEFAPGEIVLQKSSNDTLKNMADIMQTCYIVPMEIGGHTDSQGRKSLNLSISQARAEAVMDSLLSYDILTGNLIAKGYGESTPIADNKTSEGRNKNRRIEFTLIMNDD